MKKYGIIVNFGKNNVLNITKSIVQMLNKYGVSLYSTQHFQSLPIKKVEKEEFFNSMELIISLGGDGTLLRTSREIIEYKIPILPINIGTLGFLSEITPEEFKQVIEDIVNGNYEIENRITLYAKTKKNNRSRILKNVAINEVLISRNVFDKMLRFKVFINEDKVAKFKADGLIISTPTGSTGHSLSAGGPVLHPNLAGIIMTPFCAHTLTARPLIIPDNSIVKVEFEKTDQKIIVSFDGQVSFNISSESCISVTKSIYQLKLVRKHIHTFYEVLRRKLSWFEQ